jgi:hypothetical protein
MKLKLDAASFKIVMIIVLFLLFGAVAYGSWFLQQMLAQQVIVKDHAQTDAELSASEVERLKLLQVELEKQSEIVAQASQIAGTADNYQYQDQVINDIKTYADRNGVPVAGFDFSSSAPNAPAPAGTVLTPFSVNIKGPVEFEKFMQFLRDIENNLTKIQVISLSLSPDDNNNKLISDTSLGLTVYLKK